ncbi:ABC transporter permease subunit [Yinghuangia sp. YIM S09857]|uniref:ABC transporter permease subunit n=1 Tax=Yinghuangia sp. YIM S09857 TaxID=3436929 RepID=UPI003F52AB03
MTTQTPPRPAAYRSALARGGDGFGRLLHAEWTMLRTVRRWTIVMVSAVAVTILVSMLSAGGSSVSGGGGAAPPRGPGGQRVSDSFQFVGEPMTGDGTVTARVTGLGRAELDGEGEDGPVLGGGKPAPWAKAGIIVKASTTPGSTYAAMLLTPAHGVRFQSDFTLDRAGSSASAATPRWLRLTRAGNVVTGYESADGVAWDEVGSATLNGLPASAEVGLFVTSPGLFAVERQFGSTSVEGGPSAATGTFDNFSVEGRTEGTVRGVDVGADPRGPRGPGAPGVPVGAADGLGAEGAGTNSASEDGGVHTLTASGDIAPMEYETDLAQRSLDGAMIGLIPVAALGVLFITAEYRKGMILTTFTASPRRGRVLAAKALVLGAAAFAVGLVASVASFLISRPLLRSTGHKPPQFPEPSLGDGRVFAAVVGTAGVLALVAVFAMALGALLRNTAAAVSVIIVLLVLPQILLSGLPLDAARFIMQATPVAGFAVQRTTDDFNQVDTACVPEDGCYPQAPWAGFGVLFLYVLVALALAVWRIRRRPA